MPALETRFDYYLGQVTPTFVTVSRALTAGAGLTGGGNLSADRTFDVGAGAGIAVTADAVGLDTSSTRNTDHAAVTLTAGSGLTGGGDISASRSFALDTSSTRNTDHAGVTLTAGDGLTGGGDISTSRSFAVGAGTGITVNADDVALTIPTAYGTYTPTLVNVTNAAASTAYSCQYLRVGDTVTVSGRVDIDPTAAGAVRVSLTVPIASAFVNAQDAAGVAFAPGIAGLGAAMFAVGSVVEVRYIAVDTTNQAMYFTYTYLVR